MTGLTTLLEDAAEHSTAIDVAADVRRGHRALHRRRIRVATGLTGGLAAVSVVGTVAVQHLTTASSAVKPAAEPRGPIHTPYFDAPAPPEGWSVAAVGDNFLNLARDGAPDPHPQVFEHKIAVILYAHGQNMGFGSKIQYDGRTFYDNERNEGYPILAVQLDDRRWLQLQYPDSAGLEKSEMLAFLDGVVVKSAGGGRG